MIKIQHKIALVFLVLISFVIVSLYFMNLKTHTNAKMLIKSAELRQTKILSESVKAYSQSLSNWCFDYTYWDDMVDFISYPDPKFAAENIEVSAPSFGFSFVWIFGPDFNQIYGYQSAENSTISKSFLSKQLLVNTFGKKWFSDFWCSKDGKIYHVFGAPIQPTADSKRMTEPKGWLLAGREYASEEIDRISILTNSTIQVVLSDKIEFIKKPSPESAAIVYAHIPLKDINNNTIAYLTSYYIDQGTENFLGSTSNSAPVIIILSSLFFGFTILLLVIYVVKPVSILSKSLSSADETKLIPLLGRKNEFGALSRMMEHFFIQKKHLETEIKIRTETEIELKEIQANLENLVESRTSELVDANTQMQVERDQAKLYLEMAGAVICLLDEKANILLINKMGYDILGYEEGELIGKNWMDFCYNEETANACNVRYSALLNGTEDTCIDYTFSLLTSKGEERKLLINSIVTKNPFNGSKAILFSGVDITALKKTENDLIEAIERAEKANKAQAAFFANMSHELRTPLFGILGYSDMIATGDYSEEIKHMASTINKGGKRLIETLNKVLSLSKLEADKYELKLSEVNINNLIMETVNLFKVDAAAKGLDLSFCKSGNNVITQTDSTVIRDILNNLIHNAIKFTFHGSINVELQLDSDNYSITVKDTGIGIPQESVNMIFEEFRQVSEGYSRSFEGTGLGLAITKKYIDLLHGKIKLTSTINQGSEFIIIIPLKHKEIDYASRS